MISTGLNTLYIHGDIEEESAHKWIRELDHFIEFKTKHITLDIISNGGDWYSALSIYNKIRGMTVTQGRTFTSVANGYLSSSATIIYLAADSRVIYPNTTVLAHSGEETIQGSPSDIHHCAKETKYQDDLMVKLYAERTGKSKRYWSNKIKNEFHFHEKKAIEIGFSHDMAGEDL